MAGKNAGEGAYKGSSSPWEDLSGIQWLYRTPPLAEGYSCKFRVPDDHLEHVSKLESVKQLSGKDKNWLHLRDVVPRRRVQRLPWTCWPSRC